MAITIEQYKSLQRYLDNEMIIEEEAQFEKELQTDAELKEYYAFEINLRNYLDLSELKRNIPNFSIKDLTKEATIIKPHPIGIKDLRAANLNTVRFKKWILYAAAFIAVVIGSIFLLYYRNPTTQTIAKDEAKKNDTTILKSQDKSSTQEAINNKTNSDTKKEIEEKNNDQQRLLALAQQFFSKDTIENETSDTLASNSTDLAKNDKPVIEDHHLPVQHSVDGYAGALPKKKDALLDSKKIDYYNKGIDFIEQKRYKQAEEKLRWIIDNSDDVNYIGNAQWYLALTCLMEGNKDAALPLLNEVAVDTSAIPYNEKAKNLLNELKKE